MGPWKKTDFLHYSVDGNMSMMYKSPIIHWVIVQWQDYGL